MLDEQARPIICATYTHARRHPRVLGRIAEWSLPFQVTFTQLGVLFVSLLVVNKTWRYWSPVVPPIAGGVLAVGAPVALAWVARRVKIEGRSPARAAFGWVQLWSTPHAGHISGRPAKQARGRDMGAARLYVAPGKGP